MYSLFVKNIIYKLLCFVKKFLVHLRYKDVDRFRKGSFHKLYCLKTWQISKVQARSHEITNKPCTSSNYDNTVKNPTIDSKTSCDAETNTSDVKKNINRRKQNLGLEDEANNMQLDKEDHQRIKLNSKYLSVTVVLKYPDSFICRSDKGLTLETSVFESLCAGQFTLSTQLIKPNYIWFIATLRDS